MMTCGTTHSTPGLEESKIRNGFRGYHELEMMVTKTAPKLGFKTEVVKTDSFLTTNIF